MVFRHLNGPDGPLCHWVWSIMKDSRGITWIGTEDGMLRYDGKNFYPFQRSPRFPDALQGVIHQLCEDRQGNIWGATDNGVFRFCVSDASFRSYKVPLHHIDRSAKGVYCDSAGKVWITSNWSLLQYDADADSLREALTFTTRTDSLVYYKIRQHGMEPDSLGNGLWLGTASGLAYYDTRNNKYRLFTREPNHPLSKITSASTLGRAAKGNFWVFDDHHQQLCLFDPQTGQVLQRIAVDPYLTPTKGSVIFEDSKQRLWFGNWYLEFIMVDLARGNAIKRIYHNPEDPQSIINTFVSEVYEEKDGTLWFGTQCGVSRFSPDRDVYKPWRLPERIPGLKGTFINFVFQDPSDESFWLILDNNLVMHCSRDKPGYELFRPQDALPNKKGQKPGEIRFIRFYRGSTVICSETGLWYAPKTGRRLVPYSGLPDTDTAATFTDLLPQGDTLCYFITKRNVLKWNQRSNTGKWLVYQNDTLRNRLPMGIIEPVIHQGKLWGRGSNGMVVEESGDYLKEHFLQSDSAGLLSGYWTGIVSDGGDHLWLSNAGAGLFNYNTSKRKVQFWDDQMGLIDNVLLSLHTDRQGNVWSIGNNKIAVLNPESQSFYNLKLSAYNNKGLFYNSMMRLPDGNMLSNVYNDLITFFPDQVFKKPDAVVPQVGQLITPLKIYDVLTYNQIQLTPDENTVTIRYGMPVDPFFYPHNMEYKLKGGDNKWIPAGDKYEVTFSNLPPGDYVFSVRARGINYAWQSQEASLSFSIQTPFYRSWWFLAVVAFVLLSAAYLLIRNRVKERQQMLALQQKAQLLEKEKLVAMYESLKQQLNPHFLFNSLSSLASLIEEDPEMAGAFLQRMSDIYRYVLRSDEYDTVTLSDELKFAQLYVELQQMRFGDGLQVDWQVETPYLQKKVAPVTLQNMLENAIKHNVVDEDTPLRISINALDDYLVVTNNLQRKQQVTTSNKTGLKQFLSHYKFLTDRPVRIEEDDNFFTVSIPLL